MQFTRSISYEMEMEEPPTKRFKSDANDTQSDRNMSFSISAQGLDVFAKKGKAIRNATSHRIIEKRRRDRMNNCLADLNKLMPGHYSKQGQGRIEKTEIIEMAIKLIKSLQTYVEKNESTKGQDPLCLTPLGEHAKPCCISKFYMGFKECQDEVMRFLVETEDNNTSDQVCVCMMDYLGKAASKFLPTGTGMKNSSGYDSSSPYPTGMASRGSYDSLSPSSTEGNALTDAADKKNSYVTSDSGFTNMDSEFSSMSLPLRKCHAEGGQFSATAAQETYTGYDRSTTSSCSGHGAYKFKHNITQRFSQEKVQQSDTSSSSSQDDHTARQLTLKKMMSSYTQESTPYPSSSDDSYHASAPHSSPKSAGVQAAAESAVDVSMYLPGFVLHPSGSHYFPISIHPGNVPAASLVVSERPSVIFHPVSIPVRFSGPCVPLGTEIENTA